MPIETLDTIRLNGRALPANGHEALTAYFAAHSAGGPTFPTPDSAALDRYRSTWEIKNDRLYFMRLDSVDQSDAGVTHRSFPIGADEGLPAEWFNGAIYVDDAKVAAEEVRAGPLQPQRIVALHFERGIFGEVPLTPRA